MSLRLLRLLELGSRILRAAGLGGLVDRFGLTVGAVAARGVVQVDGFALSGNHAGHLFYLRELAADREGMLARVLRTAVAPGGLAVDGGAHLGYLSLTMAAAGARVVAYEPNPEVLPALQANLARNRLDGQVTFYPLALGRRADTGRLGLRGGGERSSLGGGDHGVPVAIVALDEHLEEPASVVKLDVEGWEVEALGGMRRTLAQPELVAVVECNPSALESAGASETQLVSVLRAAGLELVEIGEASLRPFGGVGGREYVNLLCARAPRLATLRAALGA